MISSGRDRQAIIQLHTRKGSDLAMSVTYRRAQNALYSFPSRLARWQQAILTLHVLRQETDCHAQNYEQSHASEGTHSEPVASYFGKIESAEQTIRWTSKTVVPVLRLRNFLKVAQSERYRTMYYVMELHYFELWNLRHVAEHLQKSVKTIRRRNYELVNLTIEELQRGVFEYELGIVDGDTRVYVVDSGISGTDEGEFSSGRSCGDS